MSPKWCYIIACFLLPFLAEAQGDDKPDQVTQLTGKIFNSINKKASRLEARLADQTEKYLLKLAKQERALKRRLSEIDSTTANDLFNGSELQYAELRKKLKTKLSAGSEMHSEYLPLADSLQSMLLFIKGDKAALPANLHGKASEALEKFKLLQVRLLGAEEAKRFISQRKQQLKDALSRYTGLPENIRKGLTSFNREAYYYNQQLGEYKAMLNDPDKITQKALSIVNKLPAFQEFMKQHSALAGLFGMPAGNGNVASLGGLQTRAQLQSLIQAQLSAAGPNGQQLLQQNLQAAQTQLNEFKNKLSKVTNGNGDSDFPDFKPNSQRTKSFLKRFELGANLQTQRSNSFYPTTTDIGFSLGYRLSDKTTIGIGGSGKAGLGNDIRHIKFSGEGLSIRSYLDVKIRSSFYLSGGLEYNYQQAFANLRDTYNLRDWSESGLIGISKVISLKSRFLKKTKVQVLWDFLSYRVPGTQALKIRVGYAFGK